MLGRDNFEAYLPLFSAIYSYFMGKIFILSWIEFVGISERPLFLFLFAYNVS